MRFDAAMEQLGAAKDRYPHLRKAYVFSEDVIQRAREMLVERLGDMPNDVGIVAFGSLARRELTQASDLDLLAFYRENGAEAARAVAIADTLRKELEPGTVFKPPGATALFGGAVPAEDLVDIIGLDDDTNNRLTRRVLLLEESVWLSNEELHRVLITDLVARYLAAKPLGDTLMARFLLNDLVRYWRTLTVDYQAKAEDKDKGPYATRYMKLIVSRKFTFASSILPLFAYALAATRDVEQPDIVSQLSHAYELPSTLRFVDAIHQLTNLGIVFGDAPSRALAALDSFVGLIGDVAWRTNLDSAAQLGNARTHKNFVECRRLAQDLESALIEIFFAEGMANLAKKYLVF